MTKGFSEGYMKGSESSWFWFEAIETNQGYHDPHQWFTIGYNHALTFGEEYARGFIVGWNLEFTSNINHWRLEAHEDGFENEAQMIKQYLIHINPHLIPQDA